MGAKRTLKKINSLLKDIDRNGYNCSGHQETLSGNLSGFHSVEIDEKNRIVFKIVDNDGENELIIIQCGGHYSDKWFDESLNYKNKESQYE